MFQDKTYAGVFRFKKWDKGPFYNIRFKVKHVTCITDKRFQKRFIQIQKLQDTRRAATHPTESHPNPFCPILYHPSLPSSTKLDLIPTIFLLPHPPWSLTPQNRSCPSLRGVSPWPWTPSPWHKFTRPKLWKMVRDI